MLMPTKDDGWRLSDPQRNQGDPLISIRAAEPPFGSLLTL